MAAIDFPNAPTDGQIFTSAGMSWTYKTGVGWLLNSGGDGGSGYTFVQDATPVPTRVGNSWFQTSTGNSFVWTDDGNSTQWVQTGPGSGSAPRIDVLPIYVASGAPNGWSMNVGAALPVAPYSGRASATINGAIGFSGQSTYYQVYLRSPGNAFGAGQPLSVSHLTPTYGPSTFGEMQSITLIFPITKGAKPALTFQINNSIGHANWYFDGQCAVTYG